MSLSLQLARGYSQAPGTSRDRKPARNVAHPPQLVSRTFPNRIRNVSPRNRNQGAQHLSGLAFTKIHSQGPLPCQGPLKVRSCQVRVPGRLKVRSRSAPRSAPISLPKSDTEADQEG
jgi:hypothetical protein